MTYADILVLVAALLPYIVLVYAKATSQKTFDNSKPRNLDAYKGAALRAHSAHLNGFETFPFFAIAVLFAEFHGVTEFYVSLLASVYVVLRIFYSVLYLQNKPTQRSIVFSLALLVAIGIFLLPVILPFLGK